MFLTGDAAPPVSGDSLLDLGLDFDPGSTGPESSQSETVAGSSLLDEQFKMLGLDTDVPSTQSQKTDLQVSLFFVRLMCICDEKRRF